MLRDYVKQNHLDINITKITAGIRWHWINNKKKKDLSQNKNYAIIPNCQSASHSDGNGQIPEWPKGTDCKSAATCFDGSNPSLPILLRPTLCRSFFLQIIKK